MRRRPEIARRERFGIDQSASIQAELRRRAQVRVIDILSSISLDRAMRRNVRESEHFAASEHSFTKVSIEHREDSGETNHNGSQSDLGHVPSSSRADACRGGSRHAWVGLRDLASGTRCPNLPHRVPAIAPRQFVDTQGKPYGSVIDLLQGAARRARVKLEWVHVQTRPCVCGRYRRSLADRQPLAGTQPPALHRTLCGSHSLALIQTS
jgi:hypothetical protein